MEQCKEIFLETKSGKIQFGNNGTEYTTSKTSFVEFALISWKEQIQKCLDEISGLPNLCNAENIKKMLLDALPNSDSKNPLTESIPEVNVDVPVTDEATAEIDNASDKANEELNNASDKANEELNSKKDEINKAAKDKYEQVKQLYDSLVNKDPKLEVDLIEKQKEINNKKIEVDEAIVLIKLAFSNPIGAAKIKAEKVVVEKIANAKEEVFTKKNDLAKTGQEKLQEEAKKLQEEDIKKYQPNKI